MAETSHAVPVYRGWPEKPYVVLGSLSMEDPNAEWDDGDISAAAAEAKKRGGEGIIVRRGAEWGVSKIAGTGNAPLVLASPYQTTALVIRWMTEKEITDKRMRLDLLLKEFAEGNPAVSANRTVGELALIFLAQSGFGLDSPEMGSRFIETMKKLISREPETLAGEWIYRVSESFSTALSGEDERTALGLASVSVEGENIAIVSSAGGMELNFSGTLSKGRLSGQIGVGGVSTKCEGAVMSDKISVSFQSFTPDGTVRGNVVLQRITVKPKDNEKIKSNPAGSRT